MNLRSLILSAFCKRPVRLKPADWTYVKFYFGQHGEDAVFMSLMDWKNRPQGFYIDIGAYHPIDLSNTHALYRQGWRGLTIDPNPGKTALFKKHRPEDRHITCAVGEQEGQATYYQFPVETLNTMDPARAEILKKDYPCTESVVQVRTLASLLKEYWPAGRPIDLLSVDCEAVDESVLRSNDWTAYKAEWIMVEDGNPENETGIGRLLRDAGYSMAAAIYITKLFKLNK